LPDNRPDTATDARRLKAILTLAAATAFAVGPFLSPGFGGFDPNLFPIPQDRPPVQPAGYAFAIWGPIYLALIAHAAFGLFARAEDDAWDAPRWPLMASLALGAPWIAVAQTSATMATVLIWAMLASALAALITTGPGRRDGWLRIAPLALYAGWLTAASWVSIGLMLGGYGIASASTSAWIALAGAAATAANVQRRLPQAPFYGLAVAWALVAVAVRNWGETTTLALAAALAAVAMAALALAPLLRR
jgi:MFS family permease